MMNCLIVDDDNITRMEVEQMVKKTPFLSVGGTAANAVEALNFISASKADLVFLDVMMPGISGLELIECLNAHKPQIILMTSEKKYAADAFNYDVTDFLAKPISEERFLKAVLKAKKNLENSKSRQVNRDHIFAKVKSQLVKITADHILYIESKGDKSYIHADDSVYEVHSTLKSLQEKLPEGDFMRIHNSYIINLDKISSIEGSSLIIGKHIIPVSNTHSKALMERLNTL